LKSIGGLTKSQQAESGDTSAHALARQLGPFDATMIVRLIVFTAFLITTSVVAQQPTTAANPSSPDDQYVLGPDSQVQPGVPQGKTFTFTFNHSKIFPGTTRKITVYVPSQYKGDKPACVYVGLDGLGFQAPIVFDNLIHKNEMPITIGIGLSPGNVESTKPPENPRFNRSFEFDGLNDNLGRFLLEEIFPAVEQQKTPDRVPRPIGCSPQLSKTEAQEAD